MTEITAQDIIDQLRSQIADLSFQIAIQNATIQKMSQDAPKKSDSVTE